MAFVKGLLRVGAVMLGCALVAGCGDVLSAIGGGGSSSGEQTTLSSVGPDGQVGPGTGSISGVAMSGRLMGGNVRIFNFDNGTKGELLAEGPVDSQGNYRVDLTVRSQPVLIEITGGRYIEPASASTVTLNNGQVLLAVQNYRNGSTTSVSLDYYTTLAAGLAENLVRMGANPPQAVVDANQRIPALVGLAAGFDAVASTPVDISSPASVTPFVTTELEYGFATAALSSLTEAASITASRPVHETINSISLIQLALDDVRRDGVLDGQGTQGALAIGVTPLSADVYRNALALNVLRIASNTQSNRSSIGPAQVLPLAQRFNNSTDPIYGGRPIIPLNAEAPVIADISIAPNALLAGPVTLTASATSVFGITSVEVLIDNVVVGAAMDPVTPSITLDTTTIADGGHQLSVRATDLIGGRTTTPALTVTISNAQGSISNISLANDSIVRGTVTVTADIVDGAGIAEVRYFVDNFQPVVTTDPRAPFLLDTVGLRLEEVLEHMLRITAINNLGREITSTTINFRVDNQAPNLVVTAPAAGAFLRQQFTLVASATDNSQFGRLELSIDAEPRPDITRVPEGFFINTLSFPEGDHVLAVRVQDQAGNDAVATVPVVFDNTPPTVTITSPAQNAAIRGPFDVIAMLGDTFALGATATTFLNPPTLDPTQLLALGGGIERAVIHTSPMQGTVTLPIEAAAIPADGPHTYVVAVRDQAGNASISGPVAVMVDNTPPQITNLRVDLENGNCVVRGTVVDASPISAVTVTTRRNGQDVDSSPGFPSLVLTLPVVAVLAGDATARIATVDSLGNVGALQLRIRVTGLQVVGQGQPPIGMPQNLSCMLTVE